ncbi:uncharacterized protein UBRO_20863 [Ustilago bromivora]|uniref:DDE Tnp4 domain-containing protein n=1 Tax=Ustilago bromivora TaxID=307758 RepID=A0A1K0GAM2_9BASI|nr:uncharacterized protein UBRO_20863 [Ustilago bromivora]
MDPVLLHIRSYDNKVFKANFRSPNFQLAVFLYRMGQHGNGASIRDIAHILGLSMGSVVNYSKSVTAALFDAHSQSLAWATEDKKIKSKDWVLTKTRIPEWKHGFAMVDGMLVPLQFTPGMEGHFDRKKNYSLNIQLVVLPPTSRSSSMLLAALDLLMTAALLPSLTSSRILAVISPRENGFGPT